MKAVAIQVSQAMPPAKTTPLVRDPQFWIATTTAIIAAGFLLRALLPKLGVKVSKGVSSKVTLTVSGKSIKK